MTRITKEDALKAMERNGIIGLLEALELIEPEPEPVVEKTPTELFLGKMRDSGWLSHLDAHKACDDAIASAGLKLIKASDELVAVDDIGARSAFINAICPPPQAYLIHPQETVELLKQLGYVIAKRAGS